MFGIDTNILVRYLTQDDPNQAKRVNKLFDIAVKNREKIHIDIVVLCELVWVLREAYGFNKKTVVLTIEQILSAAQFSIQDRDIISQALEIYSQNNGDFADYLIGLKNRIRDCNITVTFDKALKNNPLFSLL
ncbi:MAG: type II toxin-antitoxin system VapC family toxin [Deltaproteobacteria bacterium]|nr:type II toxin-antitoxin system VapC family toxin [Deltaproteobacteria bacterium]